MKNKILVITGPAESGKSFLMRQIAGDDAILIRGNRSMINDPHMFDCFEPGKTKYICLDNVTDFEVLEWAGKNADSPHINVERKGRTSITVPTKDVQFIIETNIPLARMKEVWGLSITKHFNVIELRDCSMRGSTALNEDSKL